VGSKKIKREAKDFPTGGASLTVQKEEIARGKDRKVDRNRERERKNARLYWDVASALLRPNLGEKSSEAARGERPKISGDQRPPSACSHTP